MGSLEVRRGCGNRTAVPGRILKEVLLVQAPYVPPFVHMLPSFLSPEPFLYPYITFRIVLSVLNTPVFKFPGLLRP